jgi:hypothetical protein
VDGADTKQWCHQHQHQHQHSHHSGPPQPTRSVVVYLHNVWRVVFGVPSRIQSSHLWEEPVLLQQRLHSYPRRPPKAYDGHIHTGISPTPPFHYPSTPCDRIVLLRSLFRAAPRPPCR